MQRIFFVVSCVVAPVALACVHRPSPPMDVAAPERPPTYEVPGAVTYRPVVLRAVARALADRSFYSSATPPAYGLAFQDGLRRAQREGGVPVTGRIDVATLRMLGLEHLTDSLSAFTPRRTQPDPPAAPRILARFASDSPYRAPPNGGIAWTAVVRIPGAAAVRLYLQRVALGANDTLVVRSARNVVVARYAEPAADSIWTEYLGPLPLTVQVVAARGTRGGVVRITRAQVRLAPGAAQDSLGAEAIIGTDDSSPIGNEPISGENYHRGAAVAVLADAGGTFCTGFLIGPNRLMTNNHCIATQAECTASLGRFNFQVDAAGNDLTTTDYDCQQLLQTDATLDYSVVQLAGTPGYEWGYLRLTWDNVYNGEPLTIIGHPSAGRKRVSSANCSVSEAVSPSPVDGTAATDISHVCDTRPGNSGSPVFDLRRYEVIALHHWGLGGDADNEAVRMRRILAHCAVCAQPFAPPGKKFDLDGDSKHDVFVRSPEWAGVMRSSGNDVSTLWIKGNWVGQWNLGTDNWDLSANVDGDGHSDIVLRSPEWLGVLKGGANAMTMGWLKFDTVGTWNLGFDDHALVGDFDGDGKDDLVMRSDEWIGLLRSDGTRFHSQWLAHDWLGRWNLGRPDRIWVGDFTGDGKDDVFIRSPEWAGLFRSQGTSLQEIWMTHDWLGPWNLGDGDEHFVGDFDGDGKDDVLTRSNEWMSLWKSTGTGFTVAWIQHDWVGQWNLGWQDWHHVADFTGDGKDDVLIRSNEWIGVLTPSGSSFSLAWIHHDWLGQWNLGMPDRESVGDYNGDGKADVLVRSPEWIGRFLSNGTSLTQDFIRHDWLGSWNLGEVDRHAGGR